MTKLLLIGAGGCLGALARYGVMRLVHRWFQGALPLGTLTVNVLGCLTIGGMMHLVEDRQMIGPNARLFLMIGLLGAFTTFSTFGYETLALTRGGSLRLALMNVGLHVVVGLTAVWLGHTLLRLVRM